MMHGTCGKQCIVIHRIPVKVEAYLRSGKIIIVENKEFKSEPAKPSRVWQVVVL